MRETEASRYTLRDTFSSPWPEVYSPCWPSASVALGLEFKLPLCHHPTVTGGHNRKSSDSCNLESGVHKHPP